VVSLVRRPPFFRLALACTDSFRLSGIGTDYEAIARITNQRLEHCEKVRFPRPLPSTSAVDALLLSQLSQVPGYGHISY
jgi:hypothetical protein